MRIPQPRILFIDAYDSFSNNIISLLETTLSCSVRTVKIDNPFLLASDEALREELRHYVAVVCGPGPGHPENDRDVGIFKKIWRLGEEDVLPVLGICLGFQSLCLEFGAKVGRLRGPQHGIIRKVTHIGECGRLGENTIFEGVGELKATHYQSLCVDIGQDAINTRMWQDIKWGQPVRSPLLIPLAYAESDLSVPNDSGIKDERVLVAVQHSSKPFWALQYHPESICTREESHKAIKNWFRLAQRWNETHRRRTICHESPKYGNLVVRPSLLSRYNSASCLEICESPQETVCFWKTVDLPSGISVVDLADEMCAGQSRVIFESTNANEIVSGTADVRGRYSIIALEVDNAARIEYQVGADHVTRRWLDREEKYPLESGSAWSFVARYLEHRKVSQGPAESPFWGGFMGFTTYELGLEAIDVPSTKTRLESRPDLCFTWVDKSVVVDHRKNQVYIQQLSHQRNQGVIQAQLSESRAALQKYFHSRLPPSPSGSINSDLESIKVDTPLSTPPLSTSSSRINLQSTKPTTSTTPLSVRKPNDLIYETEVLTCQSFISAGDSYELCLTDQTTVLRPKFSQSSSWSLYKTLRIRQPAPFASFISLGAATLISSSPERFLTWDERNHCSLRPMKGTVRKSAEVDTLEKAKELLDVPKEKAENLMIVDLVRHDLHGICGSGNVQVPRLCVVEEYKSVFQMITVVEGQIPAVAAGQENVRHTGIDVLAASLPPGSMTGAPKKRSCEILQGIEEQERSLYSGVVGYLDVRGRGDWSVTIRSAFKWDDEDDVVEVDGRLVQTEKWRIGAGGAVTTLSTAVGEREEMCTKLAGTLGIFS